MRHPHGQQQAVGEGLVGQAGQIPEIRAGRRDRDQVIQGHCQPIKARILQPHQNGGHRQQHAAGTGKRSQALLRCEGHVGNTGQGRAVAAGQRPPASSTPGPWPPPPRPRLLSKGDWTDANQDCPSSMDRETSCCSLGIWHTLTVTVCSCLSYRVLLCAARAFSAASALVQRSLCAQVYCVHVDSRAVHSLGQLGPRFDHAHDVKKETPSQVFFFVPVLHTQQGCTANTSGSLLT